MTDKGRARRFLGQLPANVDPTRPSVARVYDFYLGGSHNFAADREFGRQALERMPSLPRHAREYRAFIGRVVRYMCSQGIDQFLDLGSGLPTVGNVHETAQGINPQARVVYIDHDPVAVAHGDLILDDNPLATSIESDLRRPDGVLDAVADSGVLDLDRPVGILMVAVLHFIPDDERPREFLMEYMAACAPRSHLALAQARSDGRSDARDAARFYDEDATSPSNTTRLRTKPEFEALFTGVTLLEPGVVATPLWRPEGGADDVDRPIEVSDDHPTLAGVGRKD